MFACCVFMTVVFGSVYMLNRFLRGLIAKLLRRERKGLESQWQRPRL